MSLKNIVFCTTRQWNPGDEIILSGILNVFDVLGVEYNPIIYNRHPDLRSMAQDKQLFRTSRVPDSFEYFSDTSALEANLKFGFFDNSLKPGSDCQHIDWVVFAGSPEWCNGRTFDLYASILKYQLPVMVLGVGGGFNLYRQEYHEVISQAKAIATRDEGTYKAVRKSGIDAIHLPCPALLSAPKDKERNVESVNKIGLIYTAKTAESVIWSGCSPVAHDYQLRLFRNMIALYGSHIKIEIVCHYIDDIALARRDFPGINVRYSYNSTDYFRIYGNYDLVVGGRVHGIGVAASLGVPGVALSHDARGSTCAGFLADIVAAEGNTAIGLAAVDRAIHNIAQRSKSLRDHKAATMETYKKIVLKALENPQVKYQKSLADLASQKYDLNLLADSKRLSVLGEPDRLAYGFTQISSDQSLGHAHPATTREIKIKIKSKLYAIRDKIFPRGSNAEKYLYPHVQKLIRFF
jgi:hypothetical protein